jgi:hypothetical protein
MNRQEMLQQMGLSEEDFADLVNKTTSFRNSLNPAQRAVFDKALPTAQNLASAFSSTPADVQAHLGDAALPEGIMCVVWTRSKS